ncbi:MAG: glycosyltransferase family 2 protein [Eubacterium sp.]|jgi:glycosyltransferase involved in cell wall biosynthesis|nr:glycosyltransferase family 2 protein [Eubacterium sp.]
MKKVGFVIPCYKSEKTIGMVVDEIEEAITNLDYEYEIILVNDYSPDNTFETIKRLADKNQRIIAVNLAKNFGQHAAIMAGFHYLSDDTDIICCLDDDGQTPANEIGKLIFKLDEGYDVVYAKYDTKEHSLFRNFGSKVNSIMAEYLIGKPKNLFISSYFVARRFVIDEMKEYEHSYPYLIGLVLRTTSNITNVNVVHRSRMVGESGYNLKKLMKLWLNGFTAFSIQPLRVATLLGFLFAFGGFVFVIYAIINKFMNPHVPMGWSSVIAAIFLIGGSILLVLGMIGEYVGRIYICMNRSPQFVIRDVVDGKHLKEDDNE